jgi:hypothetical protein
MRSGSTPTATESPGRRGIQNTSRAVVLFRGRVLGRDLSADTDFARVFVNIHDIKWLAAIRERAGVLLIPPT